MLQIIQCTCCGKEGWLKAEFKYAYKADSCKECHKIATSEWSFHFCDQDCFFKWIKNREIEEKGIPCQDCRETGWAFGFESNGACDTCNGKKRLPSSNG